MHIFFSAGEPSGDEHAARLIRQLRKSDPNFRAAGFGGPAMENAGCNLVFPLTTMAVMGFFRIIPMLWKFYKVYWQGLEYLKRNRPDAVVLIDFPGFNLKLAQGAKKLGIPVIYYMPPQLWAWAPWRLRKIRKSVDLVLSGLPFETEWYASRGVPTLYVGHPFFDDVEEHPLDLAFCREWKSPDHLTIGLLPGSRRQEIARNWPVLLEVARRISARHPGVEFLVASYNEEQKRTCQELIKQSSRPCPIQLFVGKTPEIISISDVAIMVSGSVSLQFVARCTPAFVLYRCSRLTCLIGKQLVTCKYMSLPNLVADRVIMPEFLSVGDPEPAIEELTNRLDRVIRNPYERSQMRRELDAIREKLYHPGASQRVAEVLLGRYGNKNAVDKAA